MFNNISGKRITGELRMIERKAIPGFTIKPIDPSDVTKLVGTFSGFPDSSYDGGLYEVRFDIPSKYPNVPPKAYFNTKVWHPNISSVTGCICLDILSSKWTIDTNLLKVITGIYSLLVCPEPDDPQDAQVAAQFRDHRDMFDKTAAYWCHVYAGGPRKEEIFDEFDKKVEQLMNKGCDRDKAIHALSMRNWNVEDALNNL